MKKNFFVNEFFLFSLTLLNYQNPIDFYVFISTFCKKICLRTTRLGLLRRQDGFLKK